MSSGSVVTQDILDRLTRLEHVVFGSPEKALDGKRPGKKSIDFSINERAYAKKYCERAKGPGKFVLLTAFIAHGEETREIPFTAVKELWGRMTAILGEFNPAYSDRAKMSGWVTIVKKGVYRLTGTWKEALG